MSGLERFIQYLIHDEGPMPVAHYMSLCLGHPEHGYYMTRDPFGAEGDFTTAPEISQMFGELIGLWAAEVWRMMGAPKRVALVELGPGRGTLMADALRAAKLVPEFSAAIEVHLVEMSPVLQERQKATLGPSAPRITWHQTIETLPGCPLIIIANEFLDALPIRQFIRQGAGWHERMVGLDELGQLVFGLALEAEAALAATLAEDGAVLEFAAIAQGIVESLAKKLLKQSGAALFIDYGHVQTGFGDTLQALKAHKPVSLLFNPGEADITAHVDFAALSRVGTKAGLRVQGAATQAEFLAALGIEYRAATLMKAAKSDAQRDTIQVAQQRLTDPAQTGMGTLFKVMALSHPELDYLPGFDSAAVQG